MGRIRSYSKRFRNLRRGFAASRKWNAVLKIQ
jgi:hypothetical protein